MVGLLFVNVVSVSGGSVRADTVERLVGLVRGVGADGGGLIF